MRVGGKSDPTAPNCHNMGQKFTNSSTFHTCHLMKLYLATILITEPYDKSTPFEKSFVLPEAELSY